MAGRDATVAAPSRRQSISRCRSPVGCPSRSPSCPGLVEAVRISRELLPGATGPLNGMPVLRGTRPIGLSGVAVAEHCLPGGLGGQSPTRMPGRRSGAASCVACPMPVGNCYDQL